MDELETNYTDIQYTVRNIEFVYKGNNKIYENVKRFSDIILSILGLIIALPLIIIFGTLIKLESPGPVIYKQKRLGIYGSVFIIYKIRSMRINEDTSNIRWTEKNDSRVTKVGRFIRRTRIDELPQIFNILKGEMSLVGPRPERPELAYKFEYEIPGFINRVLAKPGLTGWAQVNGGYDLSVSEKYILDMEYINKRNIFMDMLIILKTVRIVITGKGAR